MPRQLFGEFLPDQPPHLLDGLATADGVYPIANGYKPLGQFAAANNGTAAAKVLGAAAYRVASTVYTFAATATKIFKYESSGYTELKGSLTTSAAVGVRFCDYNDWMIMTNGTDAVQKFDPGTSTTATADLGGSPPTGRFIGRIGGYLVLAYAGGDPQKVQWCSNGTPETWSGGDSGNQILSGGGDITGFVGGEEYGLIFQENRIIRMVPSYDDAIFAYQEVAQDIGCIAPWSLASYGKLAFCLSNSGIIATDGYTVEAIGAEKFDRYYLDEFDRTYLENMSAAVDPLNKLYFLSFGNSSPASQFLIYAFGLKRGTTASITAERIFPALSQSINLESLDAIYGDLDSIPVSLDSALFRGGYPLLMLFNASHALGTLSGSPMAATIADARREWFPGRRARITSVRPISDAGTMTVSVGLADSLNDTVTETAFTTRSSGGVYRMRQSGNLAQVKLSIPAGTTWSYVQGFDIEAVEGGRA